ncbi:hypothetical protein B1H18_20010 [Streptomyces tsukubensis]|uniref:Uncharacterized protein n=2 Tax=Streptomyces tsukubensis TaxID=83656 RepID=A0A1V4A6D3_9ACTN|nr:hypothetical protein B1H18_20010 [Streptomyces tsukubensis]
MTVTAGDGTGLPGTPTLPAGPGPHPTVLLPHGSGAPHCDGDTARPARNLGRPSIASRRRPAREPDDPGLLDLVTTWVTRQLESVPDESVAHDGRAPA